MDNAADPKAQAPKLPRDMFKNNTMNDTLRSFCESISPHILKPLDDVRRFSKSAVPHPDSRESVATHIENVMKDLKP